MNPFAQLIALATATAAPAPAAAPRGRSPAQEAAVLARTERATQRRLQRLQALRGRRFGRLVLLDGDSRGGLEWWTCQCDCGRTHRVRAVQVLSGRSRSCGCLFADFQVGRGWRAKEGAA